MAFNYDAPPEEELQSENKKEEKVEPTGVKEDIKVPPISPETSELLSKKVEIPPISKETSELLSKKVEIPPLSQETRDLISQKIGVEVLSSPPAAEEPQEPTPISVEIPEGEAVGKEAAPEEEITPEEAENMGDRMLEILAVLAGQTNTEFFKTNMFWKFHEIISEFKLDKNSTSGQIEQAMNTLIEKIPEGMIPKLDDLKKDNPQFIKDFSHDISGVLVKNDLKERHAELDKVLDKHNIQGESRRLMKSAVDYLAKMKRGEIKPEEAEKGKEVIKSKAEGLWGKVGSFFGALLLVAFVFVIIVLIESSKQVLGKGEKLMK